MHRVHGFRRGKSELPEELDICHDVWSLHLNLQFLGEAISHTATHPRSASHVPSAATRLASDYCIDEI
jgi:hypothetical protein